MRIARRILALSLLTSLGLLSGGAASAQVKFNKDLPNPWEVNGFTIRIIHLDHASYGYEIRQGSQVFVHQRRNPYTGSTTGLRSKDDVLKTATWVIRNVLMTDQMRPQAQRLPASIAMTRYLPPTVAASLGITLDSSTR